MFLVCSVYSRVQSPLCDLPTVYWLCGEELNLNQTGVYKTPRAYRTCRTFITFPSFSTIFAVFGFVFNPANARFTYRARLASASRLHFKRQRREITVRSECSSVLDRVARRDENGLSAMVAVDCFGSHVQLLSVIPMRMPCYFKRRI